MGMKTTTATRCHGVIENMPQDLTDSPFDVGTSLSYRIADKLGWSRRQVHSFSLLALRDLVLPVSPKLAHEITQAVETGRVIWRQH